MKEESLLTAALRDVLSLPGVSVTESESYASEAHIEFSVGGANIEYEAIYSEKSVEISRDDGSLSSRVGRGEGIQGALLALAASIQEVANAARLAAGPTEGEQKGQGEGEGEDKDRTYIVELEEERQSKEWCDAFKGAKAALLVMRADRDSLKACALEPAVCILGPYNPYDHIDSAHRLLTGMGVAVLGTLTDRITSLGGTLKASLSWHRDGCQCPTHAADDTAGDEDFEDGRPIDVEAAEAAYKVEGVRPVIRAAPVQPEPCTVEHCVTHDRE